MTAKICVITGSRADFGFLESPMRALAEHPRFQLQTIVTGAHLCARYGRTDSAIIDAGFAIDARVDMVLASDGRDVVSKAIGLGLIGFADAYARLEPDLVMLLGDRYEMLAAATAAMVAGIPIAHLAGGDTTEGAFDEQIRHAITKMAQLHFTTNAEAARRVRQMGEDPASVFEVGSTSLDSIRSMALPTREAVFESVGLSPLERNIVVVFHPVTSGATSSEEQVNALLTALARFDGELGMVISGSNADPAGQAIDLQLREFAEARAHVVHAPSFPRETFVGLLAHCHAIVGNSSSGLYEAPTFEIPTVNVGDRQQGRLRAESVLDCAAEADAITTTLRRALTLDCRGVRNPYGDGHATERVIAQLEAIDEFRGLVSKRFYPLAGAA